MPRSFTNCASTALRLAIGLLAGLFFQPGYANILPVRIHITESIKPFALPESNSGLQSEIIRAAFATQAVQTEIVFLPGARAWGDYAHGDIDVITNAKPDSQLSIVLSSWPVLTFYNSAITLKSKSLKLRSVRDLGNLRVLAFQNASRFLGPEYADMAAANKNYGESSTVRAMMLQEDRVDTIISQPDVFRFSLITQAKMLNRVAELDAFEYHKIFPTSNKYWLGFRTESLRDQFERGIAAIYASGEIDKIFSRYQKDYATSRGMFIELDCRFKKTNRPVDCLKKPVAASTGDQLRVVFGKSRPPFVNEQDESGISVDLFREAARRMGKGYHSTFVTNNHMEADLAGGRSDVAVEIQKKPNHIFYSAPFVTYSNVVATRVTDNIDFHGWDDLKGRAVCAWQMAESNLGPEFAKVRRHFASYDEFGIQRDQVKMFLLGRCRALLIDKNLMVWHMNELARSDPSLVIPKEGDLAMAPVPGKANLDWYVGFHSEALRNRFDDALNSMRKDGTYQRIVKKYISGRSTN